MRREKGRGGGSSEGGREGGRERGERDMNSYVDSVKEMHIPML